MPAPDATASLRKVMNLGFPLAHLESRRRVPRGFMSSGGCQAAGDPKPYMPCCASATLTTLPNQAMIAIPAHGRELVTRLLQ